MSKLSDLVNPIERLVRAGVRSVALGGDGKWYGLGHPELVFEDSAIRPLIAKGSMMRNGYVATVDPKHYFAPTHKEERLK